MAFLSTFIALLLLVGICKTCTCSNDPDTIKDEKYNKVENEPSSIIEDSGSDIMPKKKHRRTRLDEDEFISDLESNKKKKNIDIELTDEEEESVRKRETDPLTANTRVRKIAMTQEMTYLNQLTSQLKEERELLRDEKRLILRERERLLKERDDQHN